VSPLIIKDVKNEGVRDLIIFHYLIHQENLRKEFSEIANVARATPLISLPDELYVCLSPTKLQWIESEKGGQQNVAGTKIQLEGKHTSIIYIYTHIYTN
jgi:hypothetical protein